MVTSSPIYIVMNNDENEVVAAADSEELAERLIAEFEAEDIRNSGCEYEYYVQRIPYFMEELSSSEG